MSRYGITYERIYTVRYSYNAFTTNELHKNIYEKLDIVRETKHIRERGTSRSSEAAVGA
jgi:hypothetical protein